ncbi:hypothetical protein C7M84_023530 [Penaeus vannamei]|uniref:Uncharacterized protein n=1 Tax=Penaeus vannamei TaxID=6689 RepID=A0A3R7PUW7_PENVA|nr:hypothetical protein C7M84_023530 [Penaeus vannamei]
MLLSAVRSPLHTSIIGARGSGSLRPERPAESAPPHDVLGRQLEVGTRPATRCLAREALRLSVASRLAVLAARMPQRKGKKQEVASAQASTPLEEAEDSPASFIQMLDYIKIKNERRPEEDDRRRKEDAAQRREEERRRDEEDRRRREAEEQWRHEDEERRREEDVNRRRDEENRFQQMMATFTAMLTPPSSASAPATAVEALPRPQAPKAAVQPPPALAKDVTLRAFKEWRQRWNDYAVMADLLSLPQPKQLIQLRSCLSQEMKRTLEISLDCRQEHGEIFVDFYVRLKQAAEQVDLCKCHNNTCEETWLKHAVLLGVRDEETKQRLLELKADASLDEVLTTCRSREAATSTTQELRPLQPATRAVSAYKKKKKQAARGHGQDSSAHADRSRSSAPSQALKCSGCVAHMKRTNVLQSLAFAISVAKQDILPNTTDHALPRVKGLHS